MKKNKFKYIFLRYLITTITFILVFVVFAYGFVKLDGFTWFDYEFKEFAFSFFGYMAIILMILLINNFISIILHELGHLYFGLKAKLEFVRFNIFNITIKKENSELKVMKLQAIPGSIGSCMMKFKEDKKYNQKEVIRYFKGGVIVHSILLVIGLIMVIVFNNIYLEIIGFIMILINLHYGILNSIPYVDKSSAMTDMYHIINCKKDINYIKIFSKASIILEQIYSGKEIKDLDKKYFEKPSKIETMSEITMASFYSEYLLEYDKYQEVYDYIKNILKNDINNLYEGNVNNFKFNLIMSIYKLNLPLNEIDEYWDNKFERFIDLYTFVSPDMLAVKYMYYKLVKKDNKKTEEILKLYKKIRKNFHEKHLLKKSDELIEEVKNYKAQ